MSAVPSVQVLEHVLIALADGTRLAAKIWLPAAAQSNPVPAILEYLPYRKRDGTAARDETNFPVFAAAGYAGVRVDLRGTGDSEGLFDDEYSPRELADACEVIDWIARQPWCSGAVGMMGISWGGFNALQVAALRPKPLKAVISIASTVDRFNDDIHFKGGCLLNANLAWSGTMLAYVSRPPDPLLAGDGWREMWLDRLRNEPLMIATWLRHQTRDAYWRHGSICEDFGAIEAATLLIAGWADAYRNAPPTAVANLMCPAKAINGPWIHKYPHFAWPRPRIDFHAEAIRWWDRWLKGVKNGADRLPAYRAYITEATRPAPFRSDDPGRWVAEKTWPSRSIKPLSYFLNAAGSLDRRAKTGIATARVSTPQDVGAMSGEFFTLRPDGELPGDQRSDDGGSLVFETAPLVKPLEILGRPVLGLRIAVDQPVAQICVRLNDVAPDGMVTRIAFGILNLTHRNSQETPTPMTPGVAEDVVIPLDETGHRFLAGHRVRIALSTAYWPILWPSPARVSADMTLGAASRLTLPVRRGGDRIEMSEPENTNPLPKFRQVTPSKVRRWSERDLNGRATRYRVHDDTGLFEIPNTQGLLVREMREESYAIAADDPLSARAETRWLVERRRGDWVIRTLTTQCLTADATHFLIDATLQAFEGETSVVSRQWHEKIERQLV